MLKPPPDAPARDKSHPGTDPRASDRDGWIAPEPVALSDGTRIQLFKETQALHEAYNAIARARRRVGIESYIFHSDDTGWAFARLLADKAKKGARIFVIYDSFGSVDTDRRLFAHMESAGVRLAAFHPVWPWNSRFVWKPFNRDHRKLLVIDEHIAGLGGLNIGLEYSGSWVLPTPSRKLSDRWRDNAMGIVGPGARPFIEAFAGMWRYCTHGGRLRQVQSIFNPYPEPGEVGMFASAPTVDSPLGDFLCRVMKGARESIDLTMAYFAPDDPLIEELCAAAARGARVRLMLPGKSDIRILRVAAQSFYETLLSAGVEIFERQGVFLHAKTMVIDRQFVILGSTNLDYRSIEFNCELSAIVHSDAFGKQVEELFECDIEHAERIDLSRWRYRPTWDRFGQWAVSRARYLL